MARQYDFVNDTVTTLDGAINGSTTSISVVSGADFPSTGDFFVLVNEEIMKVTANSANVFTVVRGVAGSATSTHNDTDEVAAIITKENLDGWLREQGDLMHVTHGYEDWTTRNRILTSGGTILTSSDFTGGNKRNGFAGALASTPSPVSSIQFDVSHRPQPATPYTLTAHVKMDWGSFGGASDLTGIACRDSTNSHLILLYMRQGFNVFFGEWDDPSTPNVTVENINWPCRNDVWLRLTNDGVDVEGFVSTDGVNWFSMGTRGVGVTATPDQIAWIKAVRSGNGHDHHLLAWLED